MRVRPGFDLVCGLTIAPGKIEVAERFGETRGRIQSGPRRGDCPAENAVTLFPQVIACDGQTRHWVAVRV